MPVALFVGGPFHAQIRRIQLYLRMTVEDEGMKGIYVPCTMWSKRGSQMILRCMVDADIAYNRTERLKITIDAMMRNVACSEPYDEVTGEVA